MLTRDGLKPDECWMPVEYIRFSQNYVYDTTIEAKRVAVRLYGQYENNWKQFIDEVSGLTEEIQEELEKIELTLPVRGFREGNNFVVTDGTHTAYALWLEGQSQIPVRPDYTKPSDSGKYFSFDDLSHLSSI